MNKRIRPVLVITPVFALLNVMIMPIFETWSGLFPEDREFMFLEVMEAFFKGYYYYRSWTAWDMWVVQLTVFIFFPSLIMLFSALFKNRILFIISSLSGIILEGKVLVDYAIQNGLDELFDFDDGNISIGTWIALSVFVFAFIVTFCNETVKYPIATNENSDLVNIATENDRTHNVKVENYCPNCGNKINNQNSFCGNCGLKL